MSIYTDEGFKNRKDYLNSLADESGVPRSTVYMLADMLGPNEDFDGLVCAVEDAEGEMEHEARMPLIGGLSPYGDGGADGYLPD